MARLTSDRLHRLELLLLGLGALSTSLLIAFGAGQVFSPDASPTPAAATAFVYAAKLLLMESALLAPFVVLALMSKALLRETQRFRYRLPGLGLSASAISGVILLLVSGMMPLDLREALDTLLARVVPALLMLSACAILYGALIWLAQHGRLERFSSPS